MRYYIIAGEASGDLHGSNLMKGIYGEDSRACIRFWGGDLMMEVYESCENNPSQTSLGPSPCGQGGSTVFTTPIDHLTHSSVGATGWSDGTARPCNGGLVGDAYGLTRPFGPGSDRAEIPLLGGAGGSDGLPRPCNGGLVRHYKDGAVMGFVEVLKKGFKLLDNIKFCKRDILAWKPDVVILIDYPGFNFKIAEFAHKHGIRTFYYIAPKVWASREGRIRKLKSYVDKLFIVFPFEIPYFRSKGVDFIYKGNPLVDAVDGSRAMNETRQEFLGRNGLEDRPVIAMLAGSRKGEISTMMPVLLEFARKMHSIPRYSGYQFIVAGAPARSIDDYAAFLGQEDYFVKVIFGETQSIVRHAEAAVVNSGTASLETVLLETPQVVGYIGHPVTIWLGRKIVKIKYISLGNLIVDRLAFKEFIQEDCNADALVTEVRALIEDTAYRSGMLSEYAEIRRLLGSSGASRAVAKEMIGLLSGSPVVECDEFSLVDNPLKAID